ncbi:MAG: thiamine pyrophosphate-requiring protein [Candidatus Tectomicrobia bacterium]|uniref:Thiamine pyrophosphate-requiring protein n=1 Tax=Tectimicrobiota bacterium TaxID=2528274 RepID=A0A937VYN9_UNCTE|nr:thiamine pyrophosphate-requiring protein [Candidatus Tectomicrobia bacterium]
MARKTVDVDTTGQAYLELLADRGIEYFFANAGTDFAPIVDGFARFAEQGKTTPQPITVPHENAAVAMAHGYYMVTGKPQAVMVHVTVGTANALTGIINAARDHVPILFSAGRTPLTEAGLPGSRDVHIHWAQEAFDQAGMVREYVKWDYELRNFTQLEAVVDRALEMAMTEPRGPVYLTLPREVLGETHAEFSMASPARRHRGGRLYPDPHSVAEAAALLAAAERPLIVTSAVGREPEAVGHLVRLAESFAIPVVTANQRYMCFPTTHPLHLGFSPDAVIGTADVVLVLDSDVPWFPGAHAPAADAKVMHLAPDPFYSHYPIRSFPCDLAIRADAVAALPMLTEALEPFQKAAQTRIAARFQHVQTLHDQQRASWREALHHVQDDTPLDPLWVSHCINACKGDDSIVINELGMAATQAEFTQPGTMFSNSPSAGLGWGLGASLGAKLAAPDKLIIATLGDGSYMFGNPTPCHFVSQAYELPTLTIIFNNQVWNAVRRANQRMFPNGWAVKTNNFPLSELQPSPNYEVLVTASGGYGERVTQAAEVQPALQRALRAVREEGRQAVLNMICKHP